MWYQWIFFDEDYCSFQIIEGTDLYDINKKAYDLYKTLLPEPIDEKWWTDAYGAESWKRTDFFDFCLNHPWFIPSYDGPGIDITFHIINFKEEQK